MKIERKVIALAIACGVLTWIVDAILDFLIFYDGTFWGLLLFDVPKHEIYIRLVMLGCFTIFGLILAHVVAQRHKTWEALEQSEQKWRNILVNTPQLGIALDNHARIIFANDYFLNLAGWSADEVIGKSWFDMFIGDDAREPVEEMFRSVMDQKDPIEFSTYENKIVVRNGDLRNIAWSNVLTRDANGHIIDVTCLGVDLTERTQHLAREKHINQVLTAVRSVNQLITREKESLRLLDETCELLTKTKGFFNAWIVLMDGGQPVEPFFHAGFDDHFAPLSKKLAAADWPDCVRSALKTDGVLTIDDPSKQCVQCPLAERYQDRGGLAMRLAHQNRIFGVLVVSISGTYANDQDHKHLFAEVGDDIAFALWAIEAESRHESIERKYADVLAATSDAVITVDLQGRVTLFNSGAEQLLDCPADEALNMPISRFFPEDRWSEQVAMVERLRKGHSLKSIETEGMTLNGKRFPIEITLNQTTDDSGRPIGFIAIVRDITKRKNAEAALKESEERYKGLYENVPLSYQSLDEDGCFLDVNPSWLNSLGYKKTEIIGKPFIEILHPDFKQRFKKKFSEFKRRGRVDDVEYKLKHKKGHYLDVSFNGRVRYRPDGNLRQTYCVFRDVTEIKKMEARIQQAQKMESIGSLASGIAHDFNNLLFPIIGFSQMLMEDLPVNSPEWESVEQILTAGKRGHELVNQILAFSRQNEDKTMPVRMQSILKDVIKLGRSSIPADIQLVEEIQPDCGLVLANPTQLHQVAMNLLTNAMHAVESTGGSISIQLRERLLENGDLADGPASPGIYAVLTVIDTGCGIEPALMEKIFEPYFTTKAPGKGTGFGLSIVYGIVKEHKGDIKVYSEPDQGTAFHVYLPVMEQNAEPSAMETSEIPETGNERILLVDDDNVITQMQSQILQRLGYRIESRVSSLEALEAFRADPGGFDLVLTDMTMPHMTGVQLARELFSIRSDIPVIICTGFSGRIDPPTAEAMGIKGLLMKPVVTSEMARMIRQVLNDA